MLHRFLTAAVSNRMQTLLQVVGFLSWTSSGFPVLGWATCLPSACISAQKDPFFLFINNKKLSTPTKTWNRRWFVLSKSGFFALSVESQILHFNFNEVAFIDKGQYCQHRKILKFKEACLHRRLSFWIDDIY